MKSSMRRLFDRIVTLLLAVLIVTGLPSAVFAESVDVSEEIEFINPVEEDGNVGSSGAVNYTYTAPTAGSFLIRNATGAISVVDGTPIIEFAEYVVAFPNFDYYKVVDTDGEVRFYQADVLKDETQANNFVYIAIHIENNTTYSIHVQYNAEDENKWYNVTAPLTDEQFSYFAQRATSLSIGTDEVSQRLKSSARAYTQGSFEDSEILQTNNYGSQANSGTATTFALNPITANSYDAYTNTDGIIRSYVSSYFGEYYLEDGVTLTDDPIVNIVPKELCFILGEHIYVGKEYGFFIRVMTDALITSDYAVDIMVFDIIHTNPSFPSNTAAGSKVEPLFQYKYRATYEDYLMDMDPSLSRVVYPHIHYDNAEYFLKDIGFRFTIANPSALNPGDNGYDPYDDEGAFIIQTSVGMSGVGLASKDDRFLEDTVMFAFGFVPILGDILSVASYVHDVYYGFGNSGYLYERKAVEEDGMYGTKTYETNNTDQIAMRDNLIKSVSAELTSHDESPRLINVGGGYAQVNYIVARKSGSSYNKIRVVTSVSVSVVQDDTDGITEEMIYYGRATGTYETGGYSRRNDIDLNGAAVATVPASTQTYAIKITPKVSGSYKIYTSSSSGDPNFRITNATKGTSAIAATDDMNGSADRDAVLTLDLIGGDIYYLEAFRYGTPYTYILNIGYNPVSTEEIVENIPYSVTTAGGTYRMLKFVPETEGYYEICTNRTSGDPELLIFAPQGYLIDRNDDSGANPNAFLECYLEAGVTYYIAVQGCEGTAMTCSVEASLI